jgi:hypothetical protein
MTDVRRTAMSVVVVGDVATLSMDVVMDATGGVAPWTTVMADDLILLAVWQRMRRWMTIVSNDYAGILGEGQEYGKL